MPRLAGSFYKRHAVTVVGTAPAAWGRTVSGAVSLPSRGAFHLSLAVLVRYRSSESVQPWRVVPPASDRVSRARPYSGTASRRPVWVRVRGCHPLRPALPCRSAPQPDLRPGAAAPGCAALQPRRRNPCRVCPLDGLAIGPLSLAATQEIDVSFSSSGYLDVSVPRVPSDKLCIGLSVLKVYLSGFPHSDIHGSKDICSSPWLFAAYHVLHRLSVPRHPPCALYSLTIHQYIALY